ncbi:uncharacterized protein A1O5_13042 [Cladophialophora psammophila CBS 110553]|uniref:HMG box domain-containing protein n=1 Tax=Cladophialophora psammophila CBS 110553 TaxID=1182543 RepID=W9VDJ8_9EURO|nr:uncharacterized protein A1O5_13042 [Cladophialophora psammophila CBS 110553]EXJ53687.1 hypothetical protein A1O5_13042 [Cladophialophora psammophila CBS 110553]
MEGISHHVAEANGQPNPIPIGLSKEKIDIMWQMSIASFTPNNNELVIPNSMATKLSEENIADLQSRFSAHFGNAPATVFVDHFQQAFHIRLTLELPATGTGQTGMSRSLSRSTSSLSPVPARARSPKGSPVKPVRLPGKKSKVPRPPNAFILYRVENHPKLKDERPELTNNQISIVLGRRWRNESEQVRAHFKDLADKIKARHAAENPGYQYAPRKSSELKRRMTARKLAARRATKAQTDSQSSSDLEMRDVTELADASHHDDIAMDGTISEANEVARFYQDDEVISATSLLCSDRTSYLSRIRHGNSGTMSVILPAGHDQVEHDYDTKMAKYMEHLLRSYEGLVGPDAEINLTTRPARSSLEADDFMNSLVDWEAIKADADIVHNAVKQDQLETLHFDSEDERVKFQQELDRILCMLE